MARPIRLLAFAAARDLFGASEIELPCPEAGSVAGVEALLVDRYPAFAPHRRSVRFAVNGAYAAPDDPVVGGDEVAVLPPVAGG